MSNLPPGCTQNDIDRAQGWRPRRECANIVEEWEWDNEYGVGAPFTAEHWDCLMSLPAEECSRICGDSGIQWLWHESRKNP